MSEAPPSTDASDFLRATVAVSSNKGGVGKTTVVTNLAIYLRALREDQPVALVGLDDQRILDRMFEIEAPAAARGNLKHGWAERSLDRVLRLGQYGVYYVPSPPDVSLLKARAENPRTLAGILARTDWRGIILIDTKSDLEALTRNAIHAADRVIVPIADWASLEEAAKTFVLLERDRLPIDRARVVFTLVDRRSRVERGTTLLERLEAEVEARGWPRYGTTISRSPRVEALNSGSGCPASILHRARGTAVHAELRSLAHELLWDLAGFERYVGAAAPLATWGRRVAARPADGEYGGPRRR
ncbi:MAG: ParA family protein [Deltaproteobacteria bacterium]|nr:ParA family protein [Deltaproteobacteria bacterium]MBW2362560.1 ParA family protein [Deltaproteobacteria bacterium]